MFQWIRAKVKNAVLAGFADAAEILQRQGADDNDDAERLLHERVKLLPAPTVDDGEAPTGKASNGRKGVRG